MKAVSRKATPEKVYAQASELVLQRWKDILSIVLLSLGMHVLLVLARWGADKTAAGAGMLVVLTGLILRVWMGKAMTLTLLAVGTDRPVPTATRWGWDRSVWLSAWVTTAAITAALACAAPTFGIFVWTRSLGLSPLAPSLTSLILITVPAGTWSVLRFFPAFYLAAGGDPQPLRRAWRLTRGRLGDTFKLVLIGIVQCLGALFVAALAGYATAALVKPLLFLLIVPALIALPLLAYVFSCAWVSRARWAAVLGVSTVGTRRVNPKRSRTGGPKQ